VRGAKAKPASPPLLRQEDGSGAENTLGLSEVLFLQSSATQNHLITATPDGKRLGKEGDSSPSPRGSFSSLICLQSWSSHVLLRRFPPALGQGAPCPGTAWQTAPSQQPPALQTAMPLTEIAAGLPSSSSSASGWDTKIGSDGYESGSCHTQVSFVLTFSLQS